jgi:hypothetical protein
VRMRALRAGGGYGVVELAPGRDRLDHGERTTHRVRIASRG